jgi:hypothetical protein
MGLVVETSLTAVCVTRELDYIVEVRGYPRTIVSGSGTGTSNTILAWQDELGIEWHYIAPGKPMQNVSKAPCIDGPGDARDFNSVLKIGRVCSCMRPVGATDIMAAGPGGDRGSRSHQRVALFARYPQL